MLTFGFQLLFLKMSHLLLAYLSVLLLGIGVLADPIIQLPNGQVQGREAVTGRGKKYYAFEGIPYTAPPVGPLRFQAPQPPQNWDGILDATSINTVCYQKSSNDTRATEDCLSVSVYTTQLPDESNVSLPVMLYIHGGAFTDGYWQMYSPELFINHDVIIVGINYRLGVFGFLSTQDDVIPGNNALKDQQLGIQWAYQNVHLFGGDTNKITIFGESAGAASVSYQLLNEKNKGLFQGAIMQSGSSLGLWALQRNARKNAFGIAASMNKTFENEDSEALLEFLQSVDAKELNLAAQKYQDPDPSVAQAISNVIWSPVIEVDNPSAFITKKMYKLYQSGDFVQVPMIIGITSEEYLGLMGSDNDTNLIFENFDLNLDQLPPEDMVFSEESARDEMGRSIRELYTRGEPFAEHFGDGIRFISDNIMTRSIIKQAELASKFVNTYFYQFSYDGPLGHTDRHYEGAESVGHAEDLYYLLCFLYGCDDSDYPEADIITRNRFVELWANFAKFQNPTPSTSDSLQNVIWPAVDTSSGDFYYIDINEDLEVKNHPKEATYGRWVELYDSLGYDDFDTY